jgi:hypothetical protein
MRVFLRAHPEPKAVLLGMDVRWCAIGDDYQRYTPRVMPEWMYEPNRWAGYAEMLNLYAVETAGQLFGILFGFKAETYGRDGYTRFVPPDAAYDRAKVARNLANAAPLIPPGPRLGDPARWRFPALEHLAPVLADLPPSTRVILFFVPYHRVLQIPLGGDGADAWAACKSRTAEVARRRAGTVVVDFMRPSPITTVDDHYWDALHYTTTIADRLAQGLAAAARGEVSADYAILALP